MDRKRIVNVTNHDITMLFCPELTNGMCSGRICGENYNRECDDCKIGEVIDIEPSGVVAQATIEEELYQAKQGIKFVTSQFVPNEKSNQEIAELEDELFYTLDYEPILVGSIIAAQAYPERVYGMVPVSGYERVPPDEKIVRSDKFTVFPKS